MASQQVQSGRMSIRLACDTFVISQTCYRYHPKLSTDNALIADWLVRLTQNQRNWGLGFAQNHKRVYRALFGRSEVRQRRTQLGHLHSYGSSKGIPQIHDVGHDHSLIFLRGDLLGQQGRTKTALDTRNLSLYQGTLPIAIFILECISASIERCILRQGVALGFLPYLVSCQALARPKERSVLSIIRSIASPLAKRLTIWVQCCLMLTLSFAKQSLK